MPGFFVSACWHIMEPERQPMGGRPQTSANTRANRLCLRVLHTLYSTYTHEHAHLLYIFPIPPIRKVYTQIVYALIRFVYNALGTLYI